MHDNGIPYPSLDTPPSSPYKAYLEESTKPITCLIFALPFFIAYHAGIFWFNPHGWANGADVYLAHALGYIGISGPLISFILVLFVFLFLQGASGKNWNVHAGTLALMLLESVLFAIPPFLLSKAVTYVIHDRLLLAAEIANEAGAAAAQTGEQIYQYLLQLILSMGAGVYEEFLFRMILMGLLVIAFKRIAKWIDLREGSWPYICAMLLQAVAFALFHHLPGSPEPLSWELLRDPRFPEAFAFRTIAGVYFAYIYQERGFGVAAGSHAMYDIFAVTQNALR